MVFTNKNKAKISRIILSLYNENIKIYTEKSFNAYQKFDSFLLWYVNITKSQRRLTFTFFICFIAFKQYHNNNKTCCNVWIYIAISGIKVSFFSLQNVTNRLSKCYYIRIEY